MKNENLLDQFILIDQDVVKQLVDNALLNDKDIVLEIGAGEGIVTREIAKKARRVIAVEIDKRYAPGLRKLPKNVRVVFGNGLKVIKRIKFNKIVSSLPSSLVEPLMQKAKNLDFDSMSLLVPLKFVNKLTNNSSFSLYFKTEMILKVSKKAFDPQPKTNWALVRIYPVKPKNPPMKTFSCSEG